MQCGCSRERVIALLQSRLARSNDVKMCCSRRLGFLRHPQRVRLQSLQLHTSGCKSSLQLSAMPASGRQLLLGGCNHHAQLLQRRTAGIVVQRHRLQRRMQLKRAALKRCSPRLGGIMLKHERLPSGLGIRRLPVRSQGARLVRHQFRARCCECGVHVAALLARGSQLLFSLKVQAAKLLRRSRGGVTLGGHRLQRRLQLLHALERISHTLLSSVTLQIHSRGRGCVSRVGGGGSC